MDDTEEYNASLEDKGIVLFDVDKFRMSTDPKEEIYMKNMTMLNGLMVNLITKSIFSHHSTEINVEPISSFFEQVRVADTKVDFGDVFKVGERGLQSLSNYSQSKSKLV